MEKFNLSDLNKQSSEAKDKITSGEQQLHDIREYVENNLPELIKEASEDYQETMKKRIAEALDTNDMEAVQSLVNDVKDHVETLEKGTSLERALEIMGDEQFIGPEDIKNTFGFTPEKIPPISFTPEELERARELGQQLILYVDTKADGTPFTVADMNDILDGKTSDGRELLYSERHTDEDSVLAVQTPRLGWRLTAPELIENSTSKNYLDQTQELVHYLQNEVFEGEDIPAVYQEAIDEFNAQKDTLNELMNSDWQEAAKKLSSLSINQLTRERSSEILYRLAVTEKKSGNKNLASRYSWSNSLDQDGRLVGVVGVDSAAVVVDSLRPGYSTGTLGVCFSRSAS